jgi:hypothetical protein
MTDIVERARRLQRDDDPDDLLRALADEIERLRAVIKRMEELGW